MLIDQAAALAAHKRMQQGTQHRLLTGVREDDDVPMTAAEERAEAQRARDALRRERLRAKQAEWAERQSVVGVPPLGAPVVVVSGIHAGKRGTRGRKQGPQVRVILHDGTIIRPMCSAIRADVGITVADFRPPRRTPAEAVALKKQRDHERHLRCKAISAELGITLDEARKVDVARRSRAADGSA